MASRSPTLSWSSSSAGPSVCARFDSLGAPGGPPTPTTASCALAGDLIAWPTYLLLVAIATSALLRRLRPGTPPGLEPSAGRTKALVRTGSPGSREIIELPLDSEVIWMEENNHAMD